jgi:molybdopterin-guanine dinucleotide biosynthesis protein A
MHEEYGVASAFRPAAIVLAGGVSRRMGRDKALMRLPGGQTSLEMVLTSVRQVADPIYLSVDSQAHAEALCRELPWAPPILLDGAPGEGPLAALAGGLQTTVAPTVLLLSVDVPLVSAALLHTLWDTVSAVPSQSSGAIGRCDIAVGVVGGMLQPMPACYATRLAGVAAELVRKGERSLRALLQSPDVAARQLDEAALRRVDPGLLSYTRANTPDEWDALYSRVAGGAPGGS